MAADHEAPPVRPPAPVDPPPDYPVRWESDVVLADGGIVQLRPIRPDDEERIVAFHGRQSAESIYFRYFSSHPRLSDREVDHFIRVDYRDRMAFVALQGDDLVAVGRYEPTGQPGSAEAAFFVDDGHHGRGLATLLLEYLVVAAREGGYTKLVATVLPHNSGMLATFRQAGFGSVARFADGVVEVAIDLQSTPQADAAIAERERRADARSVARLMRPATVAVVGAGRHPDSLGHRILANLLEGRFDGPVYPVNGRADHVHSVPAFRTIGEVPRPVDLAILAVPGEQLDDAVDQCARAAVGGLIIATGGVDGDAVVARARRRGMRVLGPGSLGLINDDPDRSLWALAAPPVRELSGIRRAAPSAEATTRGRAALSVQSPRLGAAVLDLANDAHLAVSYFVSLGRKADVSSNDLLQFWDDDPTTSVVLLYLESFGNPRRFFRIARRVSRRKPIVAVSTAGAAEPGGVFGERSGLLSALLSQAGVIEVPTLGELLDTGRLLASQPVPAGPRLAIVSNAASPAALARAAARRGGLEVVENIALETTAGALDFQEALTVVLGRAGVDAAAVLYAPFDRSPAHEVAQTVTIASARAGKPVVATYLTRNQPEPLAVPAYRFPEDGVRALARAARYATWRSHEGVQSDRHRIDVDSTKANAQVSGARVDSLAADSLAGDSTAELPTVDGIIHRVLAANPMGTTLDDGDALDLLRAAGLTVAAQAWVTSVEEAAEVAERVGWPVALKAGGRPPLARTEATGLALDLSDADDVAGAWRRMSASIGPAALARTLVQAVVPPGLDARIVAVADPLLGPVVALGRGGVGASRPEELAVRLTPLIGDDAARLVDAAPLAVDALPAAGCVALQELLDDVGALVAEHPEVVEIRLDPVLVSDTAWVTDVFVRIEPALPPALPDVRRL